MFRRLSATALAAAVAGTGCAETRSGEPPLARELSAVVGGEPSPYGTRDDAVLLLRTSIEEEELVCSASLVADNLALTARHCVSHLVTGAFACNVRGELEESDQVPEPGSLGLHLPAESLEFYSGPSDERELVARGREVISTLSETICVNDIAFVVLDRDVGLPILPLRLEGRARIGESVTLVGYGLDDHMAGDLRTPWTALERNRKPDLTILDVGPEAVADVTSAAPRTILLEGPSACLGDSGGPLLANRTRALLGVYSVLAGRDCLQPSVRHWFSHVPSFDALTEEAFAAAGAEPLNELPAAGDAGAAGQAGASGQAGAAGSAQAGEGGVAGSSETSGAGASGEPAAHAGAGGASGYGGAMEPAVKPRKRSSGCALSGAVPASSDALALVVAAAACTRRRRQCRPSSGSASG